SGFGQKAYHQWVLGHDRCVLSGHPVKASAKLNSCSSGPNNGSCSLPGRWLKSPDVWLASPAILPKFFADHAANPRFLFGDRNNPMFGSPARDLEQEFCADRFLFLRSLIETTKEPGPPMTQSA